MIRVKEETIRDRFQKAVLANPISNEAPDRQAKVVLSRVGLSLLQGYTTSSNNDGSVQFELAKGHLDNRYVSKLPLPLIKTALLRIAEDAGVSNEDLESMMVVKQLGLLRDKVIAHIPNELFMQKVMTHIKGRSAKTQDYEVNTEISLRMN